MQALWLGQARAAICCQPRGEQGTGHPSSQMLPDQSAAQRHLLQEVGPPGSSLLALLALPASQLQSQGFQGCVSKGPCCTVLLAWGIVAWNGHLVFVNPHSQGICGPMELSGKDSRNQGKATLPCVPAKWQTVPSKACPALPSPLGLPEGDAWPGGRERGRGQGPWASPVGPGRWDVELGDSRGQRAALPLTHDVPSRLAGASSSLFGSCLQTSAEGEAGETASFCRGEN